MVVDKFKMCLKPEGVVRHFASMTSKEREVISERGIKKHIEEHKKFRDAFLREECYLCGKPLAIVEEKSPCAHWLLQPGKFKKRSFPEIFNRFGYDNLDCYLRWVANEERDFSSINDLAEEKADRKIFQYTIKWKNIEWTFDCANSDFKGHGGEHSNFPHYHFQMRIGDRQFINFSDFHIPFFEYDLLILSLEHGYPDLFVRWSGPGGAGMQDAINIDPETIVKGTSLAEDEDKAVYRIQALVDNSEGIISVDVLQELREESKRNGRLLSHLIQQRFGDRVNINILVSPADSVPKIARRIPRKRGRIF